jgi:NhaA family Na+:H+ antiporter
MSERSSIKRLNPVNVFAFFFKEERRSSGLILIAAIAGLIAANSGFATHYFDFLGHELSLGSLHLDVRHLINEGLMALFFLVVTLEVRREFIDGELNTWRKAAFPVFAAIGGMLVPAAIFTIFNPYAPQSNGWAIPMATDIALAVGVLGLLGRRIHKSLRIFLLSLAIVDDLGSILVISLFYARPTNMLLVVIVIMLALLLLVARRYTLWPLIFLIVGFGMWYCLVATGLSGTVAGVLIAFAMPLARRRKNAARLLTSEVIEDVLIPITSFVVVPLFAFTNAGIRLQDISLVAAETTPVFIGVFLGLVIGKPLGITLASWLAYSLRIAHKPKGITWTALAGVGCLAGIGFTISLLITNLAYTSPRLGNAAAAGIMSASVVSAIAGLLLIRRSLKTKL